MCKLFLNLKYLILLLSVLSLNHAFVHPFFSPIAEPLTITLQSLDKGGSNYQIRHVNMLRDNNRLLENENALIRREIDELLLELSANRDG